MQFNSLAQPTGATTMATQPEHLLHGGNLDAARQRFPSAPEPWIDLSTGINPFPYSVPPLAPEIWSRLPQRSHELALREAAARSYGAQNQDMVVPASGTQALIQILPRLIARSQIAILSPTYSEHAKAWRHEGHYVVEVPDLTTIASARVAIVVNPNNPTGQVIPTERLRGVAAELQSRDGLLVVDEAFADVMAPDVSLIPDLPPATIVLRSFGKMYGLAGLRLGFAITHEDLASQLRDYFGPWAVSGPALSIGAAALADIAWREKAVTRLQNAQRRLDALLETCGGCSVIGGTPLFRLATHSRAAQVADTLAQHGILVRQFSYAPTWLRFGLPGPEESWRRLEQALRAIGTNI
ncbi:threonine-phosphate decarboxylase CobD [Candidatus Filomicrobium marinum]